MHLLFKYSLIEILKQYSYEQVEEYLLSDYTEQYEEYDGRCGPARPVEVLEDRGDAVIGEDDEHGRE
jgi:hypothetical protein